MRYIIIKFCLTFVYQLLYLKLNEINYYKIGQMATKTIKTKIVDILEQGDLNNLIFLKEWKLKIDIFS